jgi:hypothetical protein
MIMERGDMRNPWLNSIDSQNADDPGARQTSQLMRLRTKF